MSDTLKPCPFCGGAAHFERMGTPRQSCIVECGSCGARHESSDEGSRSGTQWNERAAAVTQGAGTEEVERLAEQAIINCWYSAGGGRRGIDGVVRPAVGAWERRISFARTIEREVRSSLAARAAPASTPAGMGHEEVRRRLSFIGRVLETTIEQQVPQDRADAHWMVRELQRMLLAPSSPSTPAGMVLVRADLVAFLYGTGELDGCSYGEKPPTERGNYWWRKYLPRPSSPSAEPQAGEEAR